MCSHCLDTHKNHTNFQMRVTWRMWLAAILIFLICQVTWATNGSMISKGCSFQFQWALSSWLTETDNSLPSAVQWNICGCSFADTLQRRSVLQIRNRICLLDWRVLGCLLSLHTRLSLNKFKFSDVDSLSNLDNYDSQKACMKADRLSTINGWLLQASQLAAEIQSFNSHCCLALVTSHALIFENEGRGLITYDSQTYTVAGYWESESSDRNCSSDCLYYTGLLLV